MENKWIKHCQAMFRIKLPYKTFDSIPDTASPQIGAGGITVVSPKQQAVEQAKNGCEEKIRTFTCLK